jgi:hypothetical protein
MANNRRAGVFGLALSLALATGAAPAMAQFAPTQLTPMITAPSGSYGPDTQAAPGVPTQPQYDPGQAVLVSPQGAPMGVGVPMGGGNTVDVSPTGQAMGVSQ